MTGGAVPPPVCMLKKALVYRFELRNNGEVKKRTYSATAKMKKHNVIQKH